MSLVTFLIDVAITIGVVGIVVAITAISALVIYEAVERHDRPL